MNKSVLPLGLDSVSLAKPAKKHLFIEQDKANPEGFAEHLSQSQRKLASEQSSARPRLNRMEKAIPAKPHSPSESRLKDKNFERSETRSAIRSEKVVTKKVEAESISAQKNDLETDHAVDLSATKNSQANNSQANNSEPNNSGASSSETDSMDANSSETDSLKITGLEVNSSEMTLEENEGQEVSASELLVVGVVPEANQIPQSESDDVDLGMSLERVVKNQQAGESLNGFFLDEAVENEIAAVGDELEAEVKGQLAYENQILGDSQFSASVEESTPESRLTEITHLDVNLSEASLSAQANPALAGISDLLTDAEVVDSPLSINNSVKPPQASLSASPLNTLDENGLPAESLTIDLEEGESGVMDFADLPGEGKLDDKPNKADLFKTLLAQGAPEKTALVAEKAAASTTPLLSPQSSHLPTANRLFVPQAQIGMHVANPQWGHAVGEKILWMANQQLSSADIRLDPPELGSLQVKVNIQQDQANVTFISPHPQVRELLDQQVARLREMFAEQGLNLGQVDVSDRREQASRDTNDDSKAKGRFVAEEVEESVTSVSSLYLVDQFV